MAQLFLALLMALTNEQLIEKAFLAAFPGQSQSMKQLYRYELESWVPECMSMLAREVATSDDYQLLQRTIVLPISASKDIPYVRFGALPGGSPPTIDNGIITSEGGGFALSAERLPLTGSPTLVRNYFIEWQFITPDKPSIVGILPPFLTDDQIGDLANWNVLLRCMEVSPGTTTGTMLVNGTPSGIAFPDVKEGDYFRFEWDAVGALTVTQLDADRQVQTIFSVIGGQQSNIVVPGVFLGGTIDRGVQVSVGRLGVLPETTPSDRLYRLDLGTQYEFMTGYIPDRGTVQFEGTSKFLSFVPSLNFSVMPMRCDMWYWTLDGESIVFWFGNPAASPQPALPSNFLRVTGNIIPQATDLPVEWHAIAVDLLIQKATDRALRTAVRRTERVK